MGAMCTTPRAALEVITAFCPRKTGTNAKLLQVNFPCDYLASVDIPEQRILSNIINDHTEDVIKYRHIINMIKIMLLNLKRADWTSNHVDPQDDVVCYIDGSGLDSINSTGASIFNQTSDNKTYFTYRKMRYSVSS